MPDDVLDFLIESGGSAIDEIVARVLARPHKIAASLKANVEAGLVTVEGPQKVEDLVALVDEIQKVNGYASGDKAYQRNAVLKKITPERSGFSKTFARPTRRAFALSLR